MSMIAEFATELYVRALETKNTLRLDHLDPLWVLKVKRQWAAQAMILVSMSKTHGCL